MLAIIALELNLLGISKLNTKENITQSEKGYKKLINMFISLAVV
jgi:hypothetical protein